MNNESRITSIGSATRRQGFTQRRFSAKNGAGFTLLELLIQISIFGVISAFLVGITLVAGNIKNRETSNAEILGQLNFVMQAIQRMVRESTIVIVPSSSTLELARGGATTTISLSSGAITLKEGAGPTANLTNNLVITDNLTFTKFINPPANDSVKIAMTLRYNTGNVFASSTKSLESSASPLQPPAGY